MSHPFRLAGKEWIMPTWAWIVLGAVLGVLVYVVLIA